MTMVFITLLDYNHSIYRDYLLCTVTASDQHYALMGICGIIVTMKIKDLHNI